MPKLIPLAKIGPVTFEGKTLTDDGRRCILIGLYHLRDLGALKTKIQNVLTLSIF